MWLQALLNDIQLEVVDNMMLGFILIASQL